MVRPRARPAPPPRRRLGLAGGGTARPTRAVNTPSPARRRLSDGSALPPAWRHPAHAADYRSQQAARGRLARRSTGVRAGPYGRCSPSGGGGRRPRRIAPWET